MQTFLLSIALVVPLAATASAADGPPNCLQYWPGSLLCEFGVDDLPPVECAQVRPLSDLCGGDVVGGVCYLADCGTEGGDLERTLCAVLGCGSHPPDER